MSTQARESSAVGARGERLSAGARNERRKARTRKALLAAARALFGSQGFELTTIAEITERADLGVGSFYNHFDSKDALLSALLEQAYAEQLASMRSRRVNIADPAEEVSIAHRHWVRLTAEGPEWAWLLVRLDESYRVGFATQEQVALDDLARGIEQGRFSVVNPELALTASGGALMSVMRLALMGRAGADADIHHAEGVLRSFGVAAEQAAQIARRPLPPPARGEAAS